MRRAVLALALTASLITGCSDSDTDTDADTGAGASASPTPSGTPGGPSSPSSPSSPAGGTAASPAPQTARLEPLTWHPVKGPVEDAVTRTVTDRGAWTLTTSGARATLAGPGTTTTFSAPGRRVSDALLDEQYAVVVLQDEAEERPSQARVVDLATGRARTLDGRSPVPTTNGGSWALAQGRLAYPTLRGSAYCLAEMDLASGRARVSWCAEPRHGFNAVHLTPAGTSVLGFDSGRVSCRTALAVEGGTATPFPGVAKCKAWEGLLTDDGAVWSVIPREQQTEVAHYYARTGESYADLGTGVSETLTWCGDAAYFIRDSPGARGTADLLRWSAADGLTVAYRSQRGEGFLEAPRCGGDTLTITARTAAGDEQVTADL